MVVSSVYRSSLSGMGMSGWLIRTVGATDTQVGVMEIINLQTSWCNFDVR